MTNSLSAIARFAEQQTEATVQALGQGLVEVADAPSRAGPLDIAIPVFNGSSALSQCLETLPPTLSKGDTVWLLDDASTDPEVAGILQRFVEQWPDTRLLRNDNNLGFVETANLAFRLTHRDIVLLNSDTRVTAGWLEHLQTTLLANPRAGIVCPVSNNATLLSLVPDARPDHAVTAGTVTAGNVLLPTAVGFCMLISRDLLDQAGPFDPVFSPGYGEENDLSMRALKLGFDIVVADRAVVFHEGMQSFGPAAARKLQPDHQKRLDTRWPEYRALVQSWWRDNPLREKAEFLARPDENRDSVVHVLHRQYHIGGVERVARSLISELAGDFNHTLLYPGQTANHWCDFERRSSSLCRELMLNDRWLQPKVRLAGHAADLSCSYSERALARVIRGAGARLIHFHHLMHWDSLLLPELARRLGARVVVSVHDFYFNCPIHNQLEYARGQPCGRPQFSPDERCANCATAYAGKSSIPGGAAALAEARQIIVQRLLNQADAIVVPSHFMRRKILQAFEIERPNSLAIIPHGTETPREIPEVGPHDVLRLGYFGGDQVLKGASLVIQLARLLEDEPVQFNIYGRVKGLQDSTLPHNVVLRGFYNPGQVGKAMAETDLTLVPSHYEESFSLIVSESWAHGVPVLASNRGALGERVINGVNGWLLPNLRAETWLSALRSLMNTEELSRAKQNLASAVVHSVADMGARYRSLYRELLDSSTSGGQRLEEPATPSAFELKLRRFRPRHIRRDAAWFRRDARSPGVRPKCLGIIRDSWGTAQYRIRYPMMELAEAGLCERPVFHSVKTAGFPKLPASIDARTSHVLTQPFLSDQGLAMMESLSRLRGKRLILVVDDLWTQLSEDNPVRKLMPTDIYDRLTYAASLCNQVILTTPRLNACLGLHHPVVSVIENALPDALWRPALAESRKDPSRKPRVGWSGAPQHAADLDFIMPVIEATRELADWVFLGMCPDQARPLVAEAKGMVPFAEFPKALAGAGLDVALAPLEDTAFNRCKSHLKVLEYGVLGTPVVASQLDPYLDCPVTLLPERTAESWIAAICDLLENDSKRRAEGAILHNWVLERHMLSTRKNEWHSALTGS